MGEIINYAEEHPLNTNKALEKVKNSDEICCFCISNKIFVGYGDGLICYYDINNTKA